MSSDDEQRAIGALVRHGRKKEERTREFLEALDLEYGNAPEPQKSARNKGEKR